MEGWIGGVVAGEEQEEEEEEEGSEKEQEEEEEGAEEEDVVEPDISTPRASFPTGVGGSPGSGPPKGSRLGCGAVISVTLVWLCAGLGGVVFVVWGCCGC